jgi:galactoside O-acetyltransferase
MGDEAKVYPLARIVQPERVRLSSHVLIDDFVFIGTHESFEAGAYVHIATHASITGGGRFMIGDFSGISSGARVLTGTDNFLGGGLVGPTVPAEFRAVERGFVVIEAHVIIGANAVVLPNVRIGEGATVGAGAVVTKDLAPWGVYVGAPARFVKPRKKHRVLACEEQLYEKYGRPRLSLRYPRIGDLGAIAAAG